MPKAESSNPKDTPSFEGPRYRPKWPVAAVCFAVAVFVTVAVFDYRQDQTHFHGVSGESKVVDGFLKIFNHDGPKAQNVTGWIGADGVWLLYYLLGASAWLVPIFLYWMTWVNLRNARRLHGTRITAMIGCILSAAGVLVMFKGFLANTFFTDPAVFPTGAGGVLGGFLYESLLRESVGPFGSFLLLFTVYLVGMMFIFTRDINAEFDRLFVSVTDGWRNRKALKVQRAEELRKQKEDEAKQKGQAAVAVAAGAPAKPAAAAPIAPPPPALGKKFVVPQKEDALSDSAAKTATPAAPKLAAPPPPASPPPPAPKPVAATPPATDTKPLVATAEATGFKFVAPVETKKVRTQSPTTSDDNYKRPPIDLLREGDTNFAASKQEHEENARNLIRILNEFGVEVSPGEIQIGPVITRYEVVPAPGVRVEKISGLDKNIALGMRAQSVRILAPIPGKAAVGVEVPNQKASTVGLRDILESEDWVGAKAELPIAIGKDVSGKPLIADLTKMPHLLIAGATGSGKSVCINAIIGSIVYSASPREVRLLMVDPKIVELQIFNSLPHMLIPVVTEPKKVPAALKWLLSEMEQRYQIFAKCGVRNIGSFNARKKDTQTEPATQAELAGVAADDLEIPEHLPYVVVVVDELADLMMVAPAEIETNVARLAQLARAAGIHLIIATQRPSVNVITGVIKANLPSRIAFQVASQVDSRTILDFKGAETLIGRGDMLFNSASKLIRAQGAFVSDDEIKAIVESLKVNGPPKFASHVQDQIDRAARDDNEEEGAGESGDEEGDLGDDDELYRQAIDVLKSTRRASTSMLQRRLRIGYNRAARIMELMEERGIVGPDNGSSPREIIHPDLDSL